MYRSECRIYHGAAVIAAILEDYILYLKPLIPEILVPDPDWFKRVLVYSIRVRPCP